MIKNRKVAVFLITKLTNLFRKTKIKIKIIENKENTGMLEHMKEKPDTTQIMISGFSRKRMALMRNLLIKILQKELEDLYFER